MTRGSCLVLCDRTDPTFVFAWACFEVIDNWVILHFMFVKGPYQDYRLGTSLMEAILESEPTPRASCTRT